MSEIIPPPDGRLRALTIREPFATLVAMGFKPIENKPTPYPSTLPLPMTVAVHASTDDATIGDDMYEVTGDPLVDAAFDNPKWKLHTAGREWFYGGTVVGLVDIVACVNIADYVDGSDASESKIVEIIDDAYPWTPGPQRPEAKRSEWANGPFCLILANPRRFRRGVVCRGQLGFWKLKPETQSLVIDAAQDLLHNPNDMPLAPVGGVAKFLGKRKKASA